MSETKSSVAAAKASHQRRTSTAWAAFAFGLPVSALLLYLVHYGPLKEQALIARYLKHEVECVEVILFCCALGTLGAKLWSYRNEWAITRRAAANDVLPAWNGQPVPVEEAPKLLALVNQLPARMRNTFLACRVSAILDFLGSRKSAHELDDQLRTLADNDAMALEGSYGLTRFITWAIPILGFLGTVLGITGAISGITPERLEQDLSTVTDGLALAFDSTALGLGLTMLTMFLSFLVERAESSALEAVDGYVDKQLAHRFERIGADSGEFAEVVRRYTQSLLRATEQLVQRQADVWAKSFEIMEKRRAEIDLQMQHRLMTALEGALERTQETHARRLAMLEKQAIEQGGGLIERLTAFANSVRETSREQQSALAPLARGLSAQTEALTRLQEGEKQLLQLQDALNKNLSSLVGTLQGSEFKLSATEFRLRLEPQEPRPELRVVKPKAA